MTRPRQPFERLLTCIVETFREVCPDCPAQMEDWSTKTIAMFQDDLMKRAHGRVSTKWFYTHIKSPQGEKLPRVDVLNLLSQYAGFTDWDSFLQEGYPAEVVTAKSVEKVPKRLKRWWIGAAVIPLLVVMAWQMMPSDAEPAGYRFCFVDSDLGTPIPGDELQVTLMTEQESPVVIVCDSAGCITLQRAPGAIKLLVTANYYHSDTLVRTLDPQQRDETIRLRTDDYALLIAIFSQSSREDWQRRKAQLQGMFTDEAYIVQVDPGGIRGVELYTREEFINKLTLPVSSLKDLKILETVYEDGRIATMRFVQQQDEKP